MKVTVRIMKEFDVCSISQDIWRVRDGIGASFPNTYVFNADGIRHCTEHLVMKRDKATGGPIACEHVVAVLSYQRYERTRAA